jgi:hypothetical protein
LGKHNVLGCSESETRFNLALVVARQQQETWELRAAMGLAVLARCGQGDEAREPSPGSATGFTEGFDSRGESCLTSWSLESADL